MLRHLLALGAVGMAAAVQLTGVVHVVSVGMSDHKFAPDQVVAQPGDVISFQFYPTNHSVVRMDPKWPCKPYELVNPKDADNSWWSGWMPVAAVMDPAPSWNLTINDTQPLYFYCSAPDSCIKYEMVGAINVDNTTNPIAAVASRAGQTDYSLSPGETWQGEAGPSTSTSAPSSTATSTSAPASSGTVSLSTGAIAGIAIGGVIALALVGLLFFFVGRKKKGEEVKATTATTTTTPEDGLMNMGEHPPVYQDPRYSQLPVGAGHWEQKAAAEEQARLGMAGGVSQHPNRISELPDNSTYDPVEIYTPGPEDMPAHRR